MSIFMQHRTYNSENSDWSTVVFDTPTPEPGKNRLGAPIISGGMPIGNGDTASLVFPLVSGVESDSFRLGPGVHIWLSMQTAMASDMSLMPLGIRDWGVS